MTPSNQSSASSGPPPNVKKDRGAIAAQACDTCRARKHRCDEQRPKCGHCQRMKLECRYREVQPTKKDRTLVEILDRLIRLEGKVDRISPFPPQRGFGPPQIVPLSQATSPFPATSIRQSQGESPGGAGPPYKYTSIAHRMLMWPAIQELLRQGRQASGRELRNLEMDGSAFLVQLQRGSQIIPLNENLITQPFVGMQMQATRESGGPRVTFRDLDYNTMHDLATSYFDTFNLIYPFMDRQNFISDTLSKVNSEGFNGDADSVIALLVFALGELALQGICGDPIEVFNDRESGIRGGTLEKPPGLGFFNEARARLGFVIADMELESVQIYLLSALYYGACSRHVEFWRMIVAASTTCQSMMTANIIDWGSQRGDLIKRAYWQCRMTETALRLEFDLPFSPAQPTEEFVDPPAFITPFCESDHQSNEVSYFEKHYEAQIALHNLFSHLSNGVNDSTSTSIDTPGTPEYVRGPTANNLKQLTTQLDQWRSSLSPELRWPENDPTVFPELTKVTRSYYQPLDPSLNTTSEVQQQAPLFTLNLDERPERYPYVYDIQVAFLRTRFYYAKYIVNRPFVYKALHSPDQMTPTDFSGVEICLKACLKWPIALSPASRQKRFVPHLFCWTQAFFSILLILHLSQQAPPLRRVREALGDTFESEAADSIELMLDWIRDLKQYDPFAEFCYNALEDIYVNETWKNEEMEEDDND